MQSKLDMYVYKKNKAKPTASKKDNDHHDSSRENSQTQPLEPPKDKIKRPPVQYDKRVLVGPIFYLLGPSDQIYFDTIKKNLLALKKDYNPNNRSIFIKYIEKNLKFNSQNFNAEGLKELEDPTFWKETLPKMISYFLENHEQIRTCIQTLIFTKNSKTIVTRSQVLIVMIALFFGIMPKNPLTATRSFGEFMTRKEGNKDADLRMEKLKFIINYFKIIIKKIHESAESVFQFENITFQKFVSNTVEVRKNLKTDSYEGRDPPLLDVEFCEDKDLKIEDYYGNAAMVDFAHSSIGGGVLRLGSVQEEILFLIFPEAIMSIFLAPKMNDNESIVMYGLRRYSNYKNYSYNIKFDGPFEDDLLKQVNSSVMIAIDATNYSKKTTTQDQFIKENVLRETVKAITGFSAMSEIGYDESSDLKVCTGRWGCGVFEGDQIWKFFIQWVACSYAQRGMIYLSDQKEIVEDLKDVVQRMVKNEKTMLDLFAMMESFMQVKKRITKPSPNTTFIDFIKSQYPL